VGGAGAEHPRTRRGNLLNGNKYCLNLPYE
jgi:hypothetical protein